MTLPVLAGAAVGLSIAAPFGPVSLICVQHSLNRGVRYGMAAGCGAATSHGIFAAAAIAGAGAVSAILLPWSDAIRLLSAAVLVALGIRTILRARAVAAPSRAVSLRAAFATSFMLALSNPMTIIPYLALATVAAEDGAGSTALSAWSVPGVMLAALTWYVSISCVTAALRRGIGATVNRLLNLVAGISLIGYGLLAGRSLIGILEVAIR